MSTSKRPIGVQLYHHGDLRTALLAAARHTIEQEGFDALSLRQVAEQVGVSSAAPYRHFKDKNALLAAVAVEGFAALQEACRSVRDFRNPRKRLMADVRALIDFAAARPGLFRLMFDSGLPGDGETAEPALLAYASVERGVAAVLPGRSDKAIKARTIFLWSMVHGLIVLRRNHRLKPFMPGEMNEDEAIETLLTSAIDAVRR